MELKLKDYNAYRSYMIQALLKYSYYKPAKLNRQDAEDVFQDGFFKFKEILNNNTLSFKDAYSQESFIWRINKFTYLTMISTDKSKYKRGLPINSYIEDLLVEIIDKSEEEFEEIPDKKPLTKLRDKLVSYIKNPRHKTYYRMYIRGISTKDIADKYSLNPKSLNQQIHRINKELEKKTGVRFSKKLRLHGN